MSVTSIDQKRIDDDDRRTMIETIELVDNRIKEIKSELDGYWADIEALNLYVAGLRKIVKGD